MAVRQQRVAGGQQTAQLGWDGRRRANRPIVAAVAIVVALLIGVAPVRAEAADPGYAPFTSWSALVSRLYSDLTTKAPTSAQSSTWVGQLANGTKTKGDLVDGLRRGSENLANVDPVVRIYRAFLGRAPDAGGLKFWIGRKRNVAPARTWSVTQISTEFTKSNEFTSKYGSLTNRQWVTQIYTDVLGRSADPSGVDYWTRQLDTKRKTKAQVMVGFSESSEYKRKQAENTDVAVAYIYLLGRVPTTAETNDWVTRQKAGTTHASLAQELLESAAYAAHVNPPSGPGAPTGVSAAAGDGSAQVTWTAPGSTGGSPITGYIVTPYTGSTAKTPVTFNTTATSQTVTGLTNGTTYTFKVAAKNSIGTGSQSAASNAVKPVASAGLQATALASGNAHTCALQSGGTVKCWGDNDGQLGDGTTTDRSTPVTVSGLTGAVSVTTGFYHSCALLSNGTAKCWGVNGNGQLGDGTTTSRTTPVTVSGLTGVTSLSAGGYETCAVLSGGSVKCWGYNNHGQVGDGGGANRTSPTAVSGLTGASSVAVGGYHACAVVTGGAVSCWGYGLYGQVGNGGTSDATTPVSVSSTTGATALAAGSYHTCALFSGGTAKCWGYNNYGQVGNGTTTTALTPATVSGLSGATTLGAGVYHTCAALPTGAKCWGSGSSYRLGNGLVTDQTTPVAVSTLTSATSVSAGSIHSCAISGGRAKCWGYNNVGQIGDGTTITRTAPVPVAG